MPKILKDIKKMLLVRNDRFGEFLLNIPAFKALKSNYPDSRLTLTVNPYVKELAECIDFVDEIITWENRKHKFNEILRFSKDLKSKKYDLCVIFNPSKEFNLISFLAGIPIRVGYAHKWPILLTHKMRDTKHLGQEHEIVYNLQLLSLLGIESKDKIFSLKINCAIIKQIVKDYHLESYPEFVAVHPWTSDPIKQWPVEYFVNLAQRLARELNEKIIIIGGAQDLSQSFQYFANLSKDIINLTGKTSLQQLAALLRRCRLLISGDSGPVHLACAVGVPVIAIFRNDIVGKNPKRWGPWRESDSVIEKSNLCDITVEEVFNEVKEKLVR